MGMSSAKGLEYKEVIMALITYEDKELAQFTEKSTERWQKKGTWSIFVLALIDESPSQVHWNLWI